MAPFQPADLPPEAFDVEHSMKKFGITRAQAVEAIGNMRKQTVWMNDRYQVNVSRIKAPFGEKTGDMFCLSIKRRDKEVLHDWRELQAVKNAIVGAEHEGFEVYPAESRLVDTANQYFLWVFANPTARLPVGFNERLVSGPNAATAVGARQRDLGGESP